LSPSSSPGVLFPGVLLSGVLLSGVLLSGVLFPGVLLSGVLFPGVLFPGVLLSGALPPGTLLSGTERSSTSVTTTPPSRLAAKRTWPAVDSRRTSNSVALGCSRRIVNQPGWGANVTSLNVPPAASRISVAASPARYENWVADPGTATELAVTGAELGAELAVEPESGVVPGAELEDADADTGAPLTT